MTCPLGPAADTEATPSEALRTSAPAIAPSTRGKERDVSISLHLRRDLVDLAGRVARPFVDPHDRLSARAAREAEGLACHRVEPGTLEVDALVRLDREIPLVGLLELPRRHPDEPGVDIHELRQRWPPFVVEPPMDPWPIASSSARVASSVVRPSRLRMRSVKHGPVSGGRPMAGSTWRLDSRP